MGCPIAKQAISILKAYVEALVNTVNTEGLLVPGSIGGWLCPGQSPCRHVNGNYYFRWPASSLPRRNHLMPPCTSAPKLMEGRFFTGKHPGTCRLAQKMVYTLSGRHRKTQPIFMDFGATERSQRSFKMLIRASASRSWPRTRTMAFSSNAAICLIRDSFTSGSENPRLVTTKSTMGRASSGMN